MKANVLLQTTAHVILLGTISPVNGQNQSYQLIDLGTLGGSYSQAYEINNNCQIVGYASTTNGAYHAFLYSNGLMKDLGTLGGSYSSSYGINSAGQVVGYSSTISSGSFEHAFLYSNGSMTDLGTLNGVQSQAFGINGSGQIVGNFFPTPGTYHAFLDTNSSMHDIGNLGGNAEATSINNNGQIVGFSYTTNGAYHAFLYSNGLMKDLGTFGGLHSSASGISDSGLIVGSADTTNATTHAFLYSGGSMQDLGTLGGTFGEGRAVNSSGQIVGVSYTSAGVYHAFVYAGGNMTDLNSRLISTNSGWTLQYAFGNNDNGQIVGLGINPARQTHAFLLNPVPVGSLEAISAGAAHPSYGPGVAQQANKDSLIVITHGAIPSGTDPTVSTAWVDTMSNSIAQYLTSHSGLANWQVEGHKWIAGAQLPPGTVQTLKALAETTLGNAQMDGINLGNSIVAAGSWAHVHLIAHSAGAEVIQACSEVIRAKLGTTCIIHCTFLDPFTGPIPDVALLDNPLLNKVSIYGNKANWADDYFTRDQQTGGDALPFTEGHLDHAYSVDVTYVDPNRTPLPWYAPVSGNLNQPCYKTETTHGWPIEFYLNTITGNINSDYQSFGFPISEEGDKWSLASSLPQGNNPAYPLGTVDPDCVPLFQGNNGTAPSLPLDFSNPQGYSVVQIEEGLLQKVNTGLIMHDDVPAWLAEFMVITNPVNYVAFDAQFTNNPAGAGQLSVYWDANAIGFCDETLVNSNSGHFVFAFAPPANMSAHMLGFRLDAPTNAPSSVCITNVIMGYIGVSQPFSLSLPTNTLNGLPVYQLVGQPGFNYEVEASTNLIDWMTIAGLINSNGVVPFVDPDSTNHSQRFYRAVAPY